MPRIEVVRESGVRFRADIEGHALTFDQPIHAGGTDAGPSPTDVFVASLAGCVAYYVERFLERHEIDAEGLRVATNFVMAEHPSRVGSIDLVVIVPSGVPESLQAPLLAVAKHCTVHNSIALAPLMRVELESVREVVSSASIAR